MAAGPGTGPERTCVGCRRRAPKGELIRIARSSDGPVTLDPSGRTPGRGAYVCSERCLGQAIKANRLGRALRARLGPPSFERLRQEFSG